MFLCEIIFLVKSCTLDFHEMIISDNTYTERGSIKLTCCSCRKQAYESEKFISKGTPKYKTKLTFELKFSSTSQYYPDPYQSKRQFNYKDTRKVFERRRKTEQKKNRFHRPRIEPSSVMTKQIRISSVRRVIHLS